MSRALKLEAEIERLRAERDELFAANGEAAAIVAKLEAEIRRLQQQLGEAEARIATDALLIGQLSQGLR
jgi:peptidoglycan hydrolase CwlO-like protein